MLLLLLLYLQAPLSLLLSSVLMLRGDPRFEGSLEHFDGLDEASKVVRAVITHLWLTSLTRWDQAGSPP